MNKYIKTIGKIRIWAIVTAVVIAVGLLLAGILGFHTARTVSDARTLTVRLDSLVSVSENRTQRVGEIAEEELERLGLKEKYSAEGELSGGTKELVYTFSLSVSEEELAQAVNGVQEALDRAAATENDIIFNAEIIVTGNTEITHAVLARGYIWRGILAALLAVLLEFIYVAVRYRLYMGAAAAASSAVSVLGVPAVLALARIPVNASIAYVIALALFYTVLVHLVLFNKMRLNFKSEEFKGLPAEESFARSIPLKPVLLFTLLMILALALVGGLGFMSVSVLWFAVAGIVALIIGAFSALIFMPALCLPLKKASDKREAERARYDYKKNSKKEKAAAEPAETAQPQNE